MKGNKPNRFIWLVGVSLLFGWLYDLGPLQVGAAENASSAASDPKSNGNGNGKGNGKAKQPKDASSSDRIIVRGWEIMAVTAVKRASVSEVYPEYVDKKPVGNRSETKKPAKDKYLVILVQSQPATQLQSLNEPLWIGQPDVTLVDDVGFEYPALGRLVQMNGDYVKVGMVAGKHRKRGPRNTDDSLVYFDVPASAHSFWLKFSDAGPLIAVNQANDLPAVADD